MGMTVFHDRSGRELSLKQASGKIKNRLYNYLADFSLFITNILCYLPFHHLRRFLYRLAGAKIGPGTSIHMGGSFFSLKKVRIGRDTLIGRNVFLDGRDSLTVGNHVDIASEVLIYNSEHDINSEDFQAVLGPVIIGDYVFIGPRVIILPGVTIGKGAVIAAGAVVTKDIPEFAVAGGVPAQVIGERKLKDLKYKLGRARWFQ